MDEKHTADMIHRYKMLYAGVVYDAMHFDEKWTKPFVVHRDIKRLDYRHYLPLVGPAFTCVGGAVGDKPINDNVRVEMFQAFTPGCVQVIQAGDDTVAHFGDISALLAARAGATGVVIDGYTRDARLLHPLEFQVYCRGTQPQDAYGRWQIARYAVPLHFIAGAYKMPIQVFPGDFVFADSDGVMFIPEELIESVCVAAEARVYKERDIRDAINNGMSPEEVYKEHGRW